MALSCAQKLVLVLLAIAYVFGTSAEANRGWGWGWGSNQTEPGSRWSWGWGSNQTGPSWGWPWGRVSNQTGNWGWGQNGGGSGGGGGGGSDDRYGSWGWGWSSNGNGGNGGGGGSDDQSGWWGPHKQLNATSNEGPRKIIVGGSAGWQYGFDYSDWASKNAPFYVNDILVFKYNPAAPFSHSVYVLPDLWSYQNCDMKRATMIGDTTQGDGDGFEFVLRKLQPYYFASGEQDGSHCSKGTMKFSVTPMIRRWY